MGDSAAKWMDQSYYEGIPHSEVNWAELAQSWMAMQSARSREGNGDETSAIPPPPPPVQRNRPRMDLPMPPPNTPFMPPMPFFPPVPMDPNSFGTPPAGWAPPPPGSFPPGPGPFPPFIPPHPSWGNASAASFRPSGPVNSSSFTRSEGNDKESSEYSDYYEKWDDKQKSEQKQYDSENEDSSGIPQGAMAHWLAPPNHWGPPGNWVRRGQEGSGMEMSFIDQRTRKALPAWIREGLEKAEKEKQKKLEKEMKMRVAEEAAKARRLSKGLGKFDSDSSDEDNEKKDGEINNGFQHDGEPVFLQNKLTSKNSFRDKNEIHRIKQEEEIDLRTEEEKREDALLLLRRFMTEVLLTTTDNELERVVGEIIENAKRKNAQPKILAKSSALAALSSLGTESDEEGDDDAEKGQCGADGDDERTPSPKTSSLMESSKTSEEVFKAPLPVRQVGAKSKSKLSRNDDGNSATQIPKGSGKTFSEDTTGHGNNSEHDISSYSSSNGTSCSKVSAKKESQHAKEKKRSRERSRSRGRNSASPKRRKSSRKRSRSREKRGSDIRRSRSRSSGEHSNSKSRSRSITPERYRRRSGSSDKKRHSHRSSKGRSRSPDRHGRRCNRFVNLKQNTQPCWVVVTSFCMYHRGSTVGDYCFFKCMLIFK